MLGFVTTPDLVSLSLLELVSFYLFILKINLVPWYNSYKLFYQFNKYIFTLSKEVASV